MMRLLKRYIREHIRQICLYIGFLGIFQVVFFLYNIRTDAVRYAFFLSVGWLLLYGGLAFLRYYRKCRMLQEDHTAIVTDLSRMPEPENEAEEEYQRIIQDLYEQKADLESKGRISRQEMADYYGMWVHQIKTPIAALRVILQSAGEENAELPYAKTMKMELFKIEQYVEMVLSYLRMEEMSSDLAFEEYQLDDIVRQAVRKYSQMFILKRIRLDFQPLQRAVLTDEKWLVFVVEQILSNALKYTKEGSISIYLTTYREKLMLAIRDTGIGLYLCKKIMDKLRHGIYIESEVDQGTTVYLYLEREK